MRIRSNPGTQNMPNQKLRQFFAATALVLAAVLSPSIAAAAGATSTPTTTASTLSPTVTTMPITAERPPNPDDGLQADDVREWIENNLVPIIIVVGILLLVGLWKFVSRPVNTKF